MTENDLNTIKDHFATSVADLAQSETFGLKNKKDNWGNALRKFLIFEMFECGVSTLNNTEVDCLEGKLSENLAINCC